MIKAFVLLWNYGLVTGDNKGYDPNAYVVKDKEELATRLTLTMSWWHLMVDLFAKGTKHDTPIDQCKRSKVWGDSRTTIS